MKDFQFRTNPVPKTDARFFRSARGPATGKTSGVIRPGGTFAGYLHKLTRNTQFIVITHRRGTMVSADRLYGITMQEKGVSTLVSVNLIEDDLDK